MSLKSRLQKIEQKINISGIPKEILHKVGFVPICEIDQYMPEEEKRATISKVRQKYYEKLAKELNTTTEKAEALYKKEGLYPEPLIIEIVY